MDIPHEDTTRWFEPLYASAERDARAVPWSNGEPCPWVVDHLAAVAGSGRGIVVGCGLGDDAEAVADAGYETTAFDVSESAVAWCRERFPDSSVEYRVEDLFELPADLIAAGDLAVEVRTVQSLPQSVRTRAIEAVASLVAPGGELLIVTLARPEHVVPTGPPWALSESELRGYEDAGLVLESSSTERGQFIRVYRRP
jgi:SAM-dependent methyltransferase